MGGVAAKPVPMEVKAWVNVTSDDFVYPEVREAYADASGPSIKKILESKDDMVSMIKLCSDMMMTD